MSAIFNVLVLFTFITCGSAAIDCYLCVTTAPGQLCELDPANDPLGHTIACPSDTQCVVWTQMLTQGNSVRTVRRDCASGVVIPNGMGNACTEESSQFIDCYNLCDTDNCNKEAALQPAGWSSKGTRINTGAGGGSAGLHATPYILLTAVSGIVAILLN